MAAAEASSRAGSEGEEGVKAVCTGRGVCACQIWPPWAPAGLARGCPGMGRGKGA